MSNNHITGIPEWVNDSILCATAYLRQNLPGSFTLMFSPTYTTIVRSDGEAYQITSRSLERMTTIDLAMVHSLDRPPASRPAPPHGEPTPSEPPIPVPTAEELEEIEQILSQSPTETLINISSDGESESPPPLPPPLDLSLPNSPQEETTTPQVTPSEVIVPPTNELAVDIETAPLLDVPVLVLTNEGHKEQLAELWTLYQRELHRSVPNQQHRLHLAYHFGKIRHSHPSSFRTFVNTKFSGTRSRRRFSVAATRALHLGSLLGLPTFLSARLLTFAHLRLLTRGEFTDLYNTLCESYGLFHLDAEDLVFNEGAL